MKTNIKVPFLFIFLVLITCISISCKKEDENRRLSAVRVFADNVLAKGHRQVERKEYTIACRRYQCRYK